MTRLAFLLCLGLLACDRGGPGLVAGDPGTPLPDLRDGEMALFSAGRVWFEHPFTPEEGLGPLFNQTRCSSCHDLPTSGGHGAEPVVKVSRFDEAGVCSLLEEHGGDLLQASVVPALREAGYPAERVPDAATAVTELRPPPLYGLGLVEAVPSEEIRDRADPRDRDGDGISGRVARASDGAVGRFGAKGRHATLRAFVESAAQGELGLTTPGHPVEPSHNGTPLPGSFDPAPDPELDADVVGRLTAYVRFLAPPRMRMPEEPAARAAVEDGERVFERIGCAACHVPTLRTGPSEIAALDRKRFPIYSDLLLHDLGPELADVCAPGAAPSEWMTARLVGLGLRHEYLHNRRAQGLDAAIQLHGGEADGAREAYRGLSASARESLMRFLRAL